MASFSSEVRSDAAPPARSTAPDTAASAPAALPTADREHTPILTFPVRNGSPTPLPLNANYLDTIVDSSRKAVRIPLPGDKFAEGDITLLEVDKQGITRISGTLTQPYAGTFFFLRQPLPNLSGSIVGHVLFHQEEIAYRVYPSGPNQSPQLHEVTADQVVCRQLAPPETPEEAPQNHPAPGTVPIPPEQNGIPPLQSLPGASGVIYLDFDGESGVFPRWNNDQPIDAAPSGMSNSAMFEAWRRSAEDFLPFNTNVTTIRSVYEAAPRNSRMHCIITPTTTASPGAGGVAYVGSFDWDENDKVCWVFIRTAKNCAEAVSHEIGHTLGLSHDGRSSPNESYYGGHGNGDVGWAPIMGVGYYENLSQWSKGEYLNANQTQDDLSIIVNNNNNVDYRVDDAAETYANAPYLDIASGGAVTSGTGFNEGIVETRTDVDAFRFSTSGGSANLTINPANAGPNLDILAEIVSQPDGAVIASSNPDTVLNATLNTPLAAGNYILRISGVGRGDVLGDGYSDYASLGAYLISGTVSGGIHRDAFTIAENTANGTNVGTIQSRASHGGGTLNYSITSGNLNGAFAINSATGAITVANATALNFEALSTKWDDPAAFELFISITDLNNTTTESIRTVITVTDRNESAALPTLTPVTLDESTPVGTTVATATVTSPDPDRFDYITYSIASGNTGGTFTIDDSGVIRTAASLMGSSSFQLIIQVIDHLSPANTVTTNLTINTSRFLAIPTNTGVILEPNLSHPGVGPYTYAWTKISGPGTVTFGSESTGTSTASFSADGLYQLRLTISNSSLNVVDDINLNVGSATAVFNPTGMNFGTVTNGSYSSGSGTYTISGRSGGIDDAVTSDNFQCYGQTFSGNFDLKAQISSATNVTSTSSERVGLIVRSGLAANGTSAFVGFDSTPTRWGYWLRRTTVGGSTQTTYLTQNWPNNSATWVRLMRTGSTVQGFYSNNGTNWTASATETLSGEVTAGLCWSSASTTNSGTAVFSNVTLTNAPPLYNVGAVVQAGTNQQGISAPSATLDGTVSDDGKPVATPLTTLWTQVSGPGTITFQDASQIDTTATASLPGIYVLRLIANDGQIKTYDEITLTYEGTWDFWQTGHFGADASNPLIAGEQADPDQDGIPNLIEYACNTNPKGKDISPITQSLEDTGDEKYLRLTVIKNPDATDLTYTFESSGDLSPPSWTNPDNTVIIESNTPAQMTGRDNKPLSSAATRFLRLKVTKN